MKLVNRYGSLTDNTKNILKNVFGAFVVRGLSLVVSFFTMPAYMDFFNDDVTLGLWFTVLSVLNWMLNFDFGIGNGLRNHLSRCLGEKNPEEGKKYVSSAYYSIGALCLIALVVFIPVCLIVDWNGVFKVETSVVSSQALTLSVGIIFAGILLQMFLRNINSTLYALQLSSVNNALSLCSTLFTLFAVLLIPSQDNDRNLIVMAVVHLLAVALPQLVASFIVFVLSKHRDIAPSMRGFERGYARQILSLGGSFFFVQLVYMLLMNTNEIVITRFAGTEYVWEYSVYYRIFTLGGMVVSLALSPVWSAVTKAFAEKNYAWVRSLYKKTLLLGFLGTVCEFCLLPVLQFGINIWLREDAIVVHYGYAVVFACMGSLMIFNSVLSSIANGLGQLKTQLIFFTVGVAIKFPLAYLLVQVTGSWIGVIIANVVSVGIYCCVQPVVLRRALRNLS